MSALIGVTAVVVAGVGAWDAAGDRQVQALGTPEMSAAEAKVIRVRQAHAARRAEVQQASRSYTRTGLAQSERRTVRAAERDARVREASLTNLDRAANERSQEIREELQRQRRLERQRERERQRELARQRRIEAMNRWVVPVTGYEITATFGTGGGLWSSDHTGLDLAAAEGTPVGSTADGEVTSTEYDGAFGNKVVVTHDDGTQTWYCHLSSFAVGPGESVGPGTTIGYVGMTGNTTGPHLHLEVHPGGGGPVDPYSYLQERGAL
ncbi:MAG: M23 family metallopeptidase [Nocardioidaceae bacterium]